MISSNVERTVYKSYIRPAILHGSEAWCLKESEIVIFRWAERSMVRAICGVQLKGRKRKKLTGLSRGWERSGHQGMSPYHRSCYLTHGHLSLPTAHRVWLLPNSMHAADRDCASVCTGVVKVADKMVSRVIYPSNITDCCFQVRYELDSSAALISFSTHDQALRAYHSSQPVFNNRFIKVFWHRPISKQPTGEGSADTALLDPGSDIKQDVHSRLGPRDEGQPASSTTCDNNDEVRPCPPPRPPHTCPCVRVCFCLGMILSKLSFLRLEASPHPSYSPPSPMCDHGNTLSVPFRPGCRLRSRRWTEVPGSKPTLMFEAYTYASSFFDAWWISVCDGIGCVVSARPTWNVFRIADVAAMPRCELWWLGLMTTVAVGTLCTVT